MNCLKLLKKSVIDSQIYVSLMGTFFAVFFMIEQNTFRYPTFFLIFITYFNGYLYTKYQESKIFSPIFILNILAGLLCLTLIFIHHDYNTLYKWLIVVILGLFYNSSFLSYYIRKIPLLKIFYVGLVWGLINSWVIFENFHLPIFTITFFYITALVLPFDIRDIKVDQITTFPNLIGIEKTKYIAYFMLSVAAATAIKQLENTFAIAFSFSSLIAFAFVYFSSEEKKDSYYSFGVETCCGASLIFLGIIELFKVF